MKSSDNAHASYPQQQIRRADRAVDDRDGALAIIDECWFAHVGFVDGDLPYVMPMAFARTGETLYLHGGALARIMQELSRGIPVCLTFTLLDGLVLAKTAFHHSMNYRSVVVVGKANLVIDETEKRHAFDSLVDKLLPGRSKLLRPSNASELSATILVRVALEQITCKAKSGPPREPVTDDSIDGFVGVVPVRTTTDWTGTIGR